MEKVIAIFDLEGTIFKPSRSFLHEITKSQAGEISGVIKVAIFNISFMMLYMFYKIHLVSEQKLRNTVTRKLASLLKGSVESEIAQRARVYAAKSMSLLWPEISGILKDHKTKGHITIVISGMLQPYIEAMKQELGIDIALGTELEIKDGHYTGQLASLPYFGQQRAQVLAKLISNLDYKINLDSSFAYGDSILDRFFMGMVGNPVAIHPDRKLLNYAQEHAWSIVPFYKGTSITPPKSFLKD